MFYNTRFESNVRLHRVVNLDDRSLRTELDEFAGRAKLQGMKPALAAMVYTIRFLADQALCARYIGALNGAPSTEAVAHINETDRKVLAHLDRLATEFLEGSTAPIDRVLEEFDAERAEDRNPRVR